MTVQSRINCVALLALAGCSTNFSVQPCDTDEDCGKSLVCETRGKESVCVDPDEAPLIIGQSAPASGTNQALGTEMKLGIELAFAEKNEAGGIRGRKLQLEFRDDAYQPDLAEEAARALVDAQSMQGAPRCPTVSSAPLARGPNSVLAFLGNVGTPTMMRSAPVALETGTLFFGAFTGAAAILRDDKAADCHRFVFNIRASYAQEAQATMEYFKYRGVTDARHLLSFDQDDSFGQAGYDGLVSAYQTVVGAFPNGTDTKTPVARFRYTRNDDGSVPAQAAAAVKYIASLLRGDSDNHTIGIMMTDTYGAGASFIEALRTWQYADDAEQKELGKADRLRILFSNVSFVGSNALSDRLVQAGSLTTTSWGKIPFTQDVMVSQVVPNYQSDSSEIVSSYNRLIKERGATPSFTSLEGYISARVFIAGLEAHKGPFRPDTLIDTFEQLPDLSLGIGASSGFSAKSHQYSNSVWGTLIQPDGSFKNVYFWSSRIPIEFFE